MLAWALRSHTAPARVGFLAMCRGKVERNNSKVDIVPVSQNYGRRMCVSDKRVSFCPGSDLPGSYRPITLNVTVIFPFRPKNVNNRRGM